MFGLGVLIAPVVVIKVLFESRAIIFLPLTEWIGRNLLWIIAATLTLAVLFFNLICLGWGAWYIVVVPDLIVVWIVFLAIRFVTTKKERADREAREERWVTELSRKYGGGLDWRSNVGEH